LKEGILKHFVDNIEQDRPKTSRIVRMTSYSGAELLPFSSDHIAWRDTASDPYCFHDLSEELSLRWTDVYTANAVQFWRMAPAGFGMFFDLRSGRLLVIIAAPNNTALDNMNDDLDERKDFFTRWDHYLIGFDRLKPALVSNNSLEAIRLEPGNRL
jgi:hypothetical protein